jgi:hypothetical protein
MPKGVVPILTEEDYKCDPYMTLQEYIEGREWHKGHIPGYHGYFEYEGGWTIGLRRDNMFKLTLADQHEAFIDVPATYQLHELEKILHAYESLRWNHRVW